jgi:hypothetical protein
VFDPGKNFNQGQTAAERNSEQNGNTCFQSGDTSSTRVWFAWADGVHFPAHCSTCLLPVSPVGTVVPKLSTCLFRAQPVSCRCSPGSGGAAVTPAIRGSPLPDLGGEKVSDQLRQRAILRHGHQFQIATERRGDSHVKALGLLCFLAAAWSGVCLLWGSARANGGRRSWWRRGLLRSWCRCRCGDLLTFCGCQAPHPTGGVSRLLPVVGGVWRE